MDEELNNILCKGGIALICSLVECPNCRNDIWVEVGQYNGFDAVSNNVITTDCYKCLNSFTLDFNNIPIQKDCKFMTVSEFIDIQTEN